MVAQTHFVPPTIIKKKRERERNKCRSHSSFLQNISDVPNLEHDRRRNEVQNKGTHTLEAAAVSSDYITVLSPVQVWIWVLLHSEQKGSKEEDPGTAAVAVSSTTDLQPPPQRGHGHQTVRAEHREGRTELWALQAGVALLRAEIPCVWDEAPENK